MMPENLFFLHCHGKPHPNPQLHLTPPNLTTPTCWMIMHCGLSFFVSRGDAMILVGMEYWSQLYIAIMQNMCRRNGWTTCKTGWKREPTTAFGGHVWAYTWRQLQLAQNVFEYPACNQFRPCLAWRRVWITASQQACKLASTF